MSPEILEALAEVTKAAIAQALIPLQETIAQQQTIIKQLQDAQNERFIDFDMSLDGNQLKTTAILSDGSERCIDVVLPQLAYVGVFDAAKQYERGELVTHAGSMWHCNQKTSDRPDSGTCAWQLCVKKGRDAK